MNDKKNPNSIRNQTKIMEDDKYMKVFTHLESVNMRNKAAFDELLRYTYSNVSDSRGGSTQND